MSQLESVVCGECGVEFAMPSSMLADRRETKATFWCPNGHPRAFKVSTSERLQKQLDAARERLRTEVDSANDYLRTEREAKEAAQRSNAALRGALTKIKRQREATPEFEPPYGQVS